MLPAATSLLAGADASGPEQSSVAFQSGRAFQGIPVRRSGTTLRTTSIPSQAV